LRQIHSIVSVIDLLLLLLSSFIQSSLLIMVLLLTSFDRDQPNEIMPKVAAASIAMPQLMAQLLLIESSS
jgi:hypothetical protein